MNKIIMSMAALTLPCAAFAGAYGDMFKNGHLRFDYTPQEISALEERAAKELDINLNFLAAIPADRRDFTNTVRALEDAYTSYWFVPKNLSLLSYFHQDSAVRDAAANLEAIGVDKKLSVFARKDVYKALKEYADTNPQLNHEDMRLLSKWLERFERAGMALSEKDAEAYAKLNTARLNKITQYNVNLNNYKDELVVGREELDGLGETYINRLERTKDGKYIITLKYPDYNPFMSSAKSEKARKALQEKFARRGGKENVKLLEDTVELRRKQAALLGFKRYPDYVLPVRMAKNYETLEAFLKNLQKEVTPLAQDEMKAYLKLKEETTGQQADEMTAWNLPYWSNQYKKKYYQVDDDKIKEYFPADKVISGMFEVFGTLFGITFTQADLPVWHPEVVVYQIKDKKTGELISNFYLDLFPRDGKYTHAATWSFVDRFELPDGQMQTPSVVIAANFTPAGNGMPSLLEHSEVETLFHEFGHVLQMSMATSKYATLTGDNVAWDYIEAHSQLLENWAWQPQVLKKISAHYKTGETLPDGLISSLVKSKNVGVAVAFLRQNFLGQYDLALHTADKRVDSTKLYAQMMHNISGIPMTKGTYPQASFGHIMSLTDPYDVGYYVYAWSLVIAQDIFARFEDEGLFNAELGAKLRKYIYTPGTVYDENEMVEQFLGRPYNDKAFLKSLGIK
ncbi:M3 family metallopeptidase [Candidatus Avelusimicrobium fimicolum]|uniref:M3 family metallopeptidase n=1 Tax=Candidatus Avelusimicrobium fimicolum TaxID=3416216 RepID=UPI003D14EC29